MDNPPKILSFLIAGTLLAITLRTKTGISIIQMVRSPVLSPLATFLKMIRFRLMCWAPRMRLKLWKIREKILTLSILLTICGLLMILLSLPCLV